MFFFRKLQRTYSQSPTEAWKDTWRSLVPPECRNVPVKAAGESIEAYVLMNHFAMMLQDGLLMEEAFFPVCEHFQRAGYHVIWLMRCTQDIHNGYLKKAGERDGTTRWLWKSPTTNFGRWISDNHEATILLQHQELPPGELLSCQEPILGRVTWASSDDDTRMVPGRTEFYTVPLPGTPKELLRFLEGQPLRTLGCR